MSVWRLDYEGFDPEREGFREALCTLGNGRFATRGAAPESTADGVHYPGTYLAGHYDRLVDEVAGRRLENESLVNAPNWLPLTFRIEDGEWFDPGKVELLAYRQTLDTRHGLLLRRVRFRDGAGRTTLLEQRRFVHMSRPDLAGLETVITAEDWSGRLDVLTAIDGRVTNAGVARYSELSGEHLAPVLEEETDGETVTLEVESVQSHLRIAESARTRVGPDESGTARRFVTGPGYAGHEISLEAGRGRAVRIEKVAAVVGSRRRALSEPALESRKHVLRAPSFEDLLLEHSHAWVRHWRRFRLALGNVGAEENVLNVHVFHVLQTISENSIGMDVGVPARGLHGEAYRGHVFWDELFVFPFLNFRVPELTRSLLYYRVDRLDEARWAARAAGFEGAMFPWQSGSDGGEESQVAHLNPRSGRWVPDLTRLQRHIGSAVAYNLWRHYQVTGDTEFLALVGGETIVEIARFWASIARSDPDTGRYRIRGVVGPDEYHDSYPGSDRPGIDDNSYTNVMAVWCIRRAMEVLELLPEHHARDLRHRLGITTRELARWEDVARRMTVVFHRDGIISQFAGYEDLEEFDWEGYRRRYDDIRRLDRILEAEGDSANRYKASKQADVIMLFYLLAAEDLTGILHSLGYDFDPATIPATVDYYLRRTSHGSTLSSVVHSWVLARSDRVRSWRYLKQALESDVADVQGGTTAEGIHLGAMAGTIDLVQRCYTGLTIEDDVLWFNPILPEEMSRLRFAIRYRGQAIDVLITHDHLTATSDWSVKKPLRIGLRGEVHEVEPGRCLDLPLELAKRTQGCVRHLRGK